MLTTEVNRWLWYLLLDTLVLPFLFIQDSSVPPQRCYQSLMLTVQICAICGWIRLPCSLCAHDEDTRSGLISHCMNVGYSVNWSMQNVVKKHFTEVDTDDTQDTSWLVVIKSGK